MYPFPPTHNTFLPNNDIFNMFRYLQQKKKLHLFSQILEKYFFQIQQQTNMGQTYCNGCCNNDKLFIYEKEIELYQRSIDHNPLASFAVQVKNSIELNIIVKQKYSQYHVDHIPERKAELKLKLHYLFNYAAYYEGQWKNGLPHGQGTLIYDDGSLYFGCFNQGIATCNQALFVLNNGAFYRGTVKNNQANEQGELLTNKFSYKGFWKNDLPHGKGIQTYSQISYFQGNFFRGQKVGKGIYFWNKQQYYIGDFNNNLMNGQGQLHLKDFYYKGCFVNGLKQGQGLLKNFKKKSFYSGQFKNNKMNGRGIYQWQDGTQFNGQFKENERTNEGKITTVSTKKSIQKQIQPTEF